MAETKERRNARSKASRAKRKEANPTAYLEKNREDLHKWRRNNPAQYLFIQTKNKTKVKNGSLAFNLTREWIEERFSCCAQTGLPFVFDFVTGNPWGPSIDRIDSSKGYTKDNCQIVCWAYNRAKYIWTDEQVLEMAEALVKKKAR
jgi:hypothetical protein